MSHLSKESCILVAFYDGETASVDKRRAPGAINLIFHKAFDTGHHNTLTFKIVGLMDGLLGG